MKVIKVLKKIKNLIPQTNISYNDYKDYCEALREIEYYSWHDLRKNQKDVPNVHVYVLAFDGNQYHLWSLTTEGDWEDEYGYWHEFEDVIAWREIEPFKDGD